MSAYVCSASQVNTAELCLRKWAWIKLDGLPDPPSRHAAFGTRTHKIAEHWLVDRTTPPNTDEGACARVIIQHVPPPQACHPDDVERHFKDLIVGDVPFQGYIDLYVPPPINGVPWVYDHKTCGDFKWGLSAEDMHKDPQATLYAYRGMTWSNTQQCGAQWTYGRRKPPKARVVRRVLTYEEIKPRLEKTAETARHLRLLKETPGLKAIDVPYDANGCEAFGGCPFKSRCNLTPQEQIGSIMAAGTESTGKNDFLAKLEARKKALGGSNGAGPPQTHPPSLDAADAPPPATSEPGINPPEPPADAAPPAPTSKPKKERKKRKTAAEKKAEKQAAESPAEPSAPEAPAVVAPPAASPTPASSAPARAVRADMPITGAGAPSPVWLAGFQVGFKMGRDDG